ncbi:phage tail protein I, partial [Parasutterella sp.]|uniref:phage tail protein I n=1 Tax=Parasutterella sp. TaxID=2049037 RepID=UPI003AF9B4E9
MKTLQDITLGDLLPDSISSDQQVKKSAEAIDPELKTVSGFLLLGAVLANVDKLTSTQLDHIAYSFDLTTWRDYWPLSQKRQVAKTVVAQKCRMGTLSAVKKVLESLGSAVSITEWWQKTVIWKLYKPVHCFSVRSSMRLNGEIRSQHAPHLKSCRKRYGLMISNR